MIQANISKRRILPPQCTRLIVKLVVLTIITWWSQMDFPPSY